MNGSNLDKILGKVQALIARADHPRTPAAEADACRNKAEALMFKYRIDETLAAQEQQGKMGLRPVWRTIWISPETGPWGTSYRTLAASVAAHVGIRAVVTYAVAEDGTYWHVMQACGYDSDLRYAELLLTACTLAFSSKLEPKYDASLSDEDNAYAMRQGGMERWKIAEALFGAPWDKAKTRRVTALFKKACAERGEDPSHLLGRNVNVKTYRQSYAQGFVYTLHDRMRRMRQARGADASGLVLASREDAIKEEFYNRYPQMRPNENAEPWKDPRQDCPKCKKASSGYCREHGYLRPVRGPGRAFSQSGFGRGGAAARAVDLGAAGTGRMGASQAKGIGH